MTVEQLIKKLNKFDPKTVVLGEFDSDGDEFMVKLDTYKVYKGNGIDDTGWNGDDEDYKKKYCIIQFN